MRIAALEHVKATLGGYFWLPCPNCGRMFGGHEDGGGNLYTSAPTSLPVSGSGCVIAASIQSGKMTCNDPKCLAEVKEKNEKVNA